MLYFTRICYVYVALLTPNAHFTPTFHIPLDYSSSVAAVADYHVALWTVVMLVAILLAVMYAMLDMGAAPLDAQLKAQLDDKGAKSSASSNKKD